MWIGIWIHSSISMTASTPAVTKAGICLLTACGQRYLISWPLLRGVTMVTRDFTIKSAKDGNADLVVKCIIGTIQLNQTINKTIKLYLWRPYDIGFGHYNINLLKRNDDVGQQTIISYLCPSCVVITCISMLPWVINMNPTHGLTCRAIYGIPYHDTHVRHIRAAEDSGWEMSIHLLGRRTHMFSDFN